MPELDVVGVKTGLEATGGGARAGSEPALPAEYLAPEASATFWTMVSGTRSLSDLAVIWTWYPWRILETAARWLVK